MSPDFLYSATMHILIRLADRAYHGGDDITSWTLSHELSYRKPRLADPRRAQVRGFCNRGRPEHRFPESGTVPCAPASTIVSADAIKAVDFDQGANDGDPRVDSRPGEDGAARNGLLKTITLEDIRSPEAKAVDQETAATEHKANQ